MRHYGRLRFSYQGVDLEKYLRHDEVTIGSGPGCDLQIPGLVDSISCRITRAQAKELSPPRTYIVFVGGSRGKINDKSKGLHLRYRLPHRSQLKLRVISGPHKVLGWFDLKYEDVLPTSVFASYRFMKRIGEGGYGVVYSARNIETWQWYAVKIMEKPRDLKSPEEREQDPIEREAEIVRSVDHINIVRLVDIFDEGTEMHIVMELMREGSLHDLIVREKHLGYYDTKLVTQQICNALAYLHDIGIVHRDIKPGNVLIASRHPLWVKLTDFGLAKMTTGGTELRTVCGTPDYMAPEIVENLFRAEKTYDVKVDSWAVGVMIFVMLSGQSPFKRLPHGEEFTPAMTGRCVRWHQLLEATDTDAKDLIAKLLAPDPTSRPSASEALLHPWLYDESSVSSQSGSELWTATELGSDVSIPIVPHTTAVYVHQQNIAQSRARSPYVLWLGGLCLILPPLLMYYIALGYEG